MFLFLLKKFKNRISLCTNSSIWTHILYVKIAGILRSIFINEYEMPLNRNWFNTRAYSDHLRCKGTHILCLCN